MQPKIILTFTFSLSSDCQILFFNFPLIVRFLFSTFLWLSDSLFQLSSDCQISKKRVSKQSCDVKECGGRLAALLKSLVVGNLWVRQSGWITRERAVKSAGNGFPNLVSFPYVIQSRKSKSGNPGNCQSHLTADNQTTREQNTLHFWSLFSEHNIIVPFLRFISLSMNVEALLNPFVILVQA